MRVSKTLFILFLLFQLPNFSNAQEGCPGCIIGLPETIPADTIFISDAPDGHVANYYNGDLSFQNAQNYHTGECFRSRSACRF